MAKVNQRFI